jgi:cytochrome c oxidase assembly protein subunit 15
MTSVEDSPQPTPSRGFGAVVKMLILGSKFAAPAAVYGLGMAVSMWVMFFVTHLPSIHLPEMVTGIALLGCMGVTAGIAGRQFGSRLGWRVAAAAGWTSVKVNLLLVGAFITKAPEHITAGQTAPATGLSGLSLASLGPVAGFTAASVIISLVCGFLGSLGQPGRKATDFDLSSARWLPRFAVLTAITFLPLILIGGLVTTTGSGMSVKGWPTSDGANMFLYPIALMTSHESIFLEHSHRLFGTLVGASTLVLALWTTLASRSRAAKIMVWVVFVMVVVQGLLGGYRVTENSLPLAMLHGILGQMTFAAAGALAMVLWLVTRPKPTHELGRDERRLKSLSGGLVHTLLLQLAMGAFFRHLRHAGSTGATHALWAHAGFSFAVVVIAMIVGISAGAVGKSRDDVALRRLGTGLLASVGLQFLLGWVALMFVLGGASKDQSIIMPDQLPTSHIIPAHEVIVRTVHQANGALLLVMAATTYALAIVRIRRSGAQAVPPAATTAANVPA